MRCLLICVRSCNPSQKCVVLTHIVSSHSASSTPPESPNQRPQHVVAGGVGGGRVSPPATLMRTQSATGGPLVGDSASLSGSWERVPQMLQVRIPPATMSISNAKKNQKNPNTHETDTLVPVSGCVLLTSGLVAQEQQQATARVGLVIVAAHRQQVQDGQRGALRPEQLLGISTQVPQRADWGGLGPR